MECVISTELYLSAGSSAWLQDTIL